MTFVQHLSIRVPWHDDGWAGTVCRSPRSNNACLLLTNIGEKRVDAVEEAHSGAAIDDLPEGQTPPCVAERATFMSPRVHALTQTHPYAWHPALSGLRPSTLPIPAFSAPAVPYFWLNRGSIEELLEHVPVDGFELDRETDALDALGWDKATWILHGDNQRALIDTFFANVRVEESLVFFYVKHSPFEDKPGRVLVGAALVEHLTSPSPWPTAGATAFPNHQWETLVGHTLRPDGSGGLLMPLQDLLELADTGVDVSAAVPDAVQANREFSYVTEHVGSDAAVAALLTLRRCAEESLRLGVAVPQQSLEWLDTQLARTWRRRGPSPGLPGVLGFLGWEHPTYAAQVATTAAGEDDAWPLVVAALEERHAPTPITELATSTRRRIWAGQSSESRRVLDLLVRFDLPAEAVIQATEPELPNPVDRDRLLDNPYELVVVTADRPFPVDVTAIDRGCYPDPAVGAEFPLPVSTPFDDPLDRRRLEAILTWLVVQADEEGHTLLPVPDVIERVLNLATTRPPKLTTTVLDGLGLDPRRLEQDERALVASELADGTAAYKHVSAQERAEAILEVIEPLRTGIRHPVPGDLAASLDAALRPLADAGTEDRDDEQRARQEKLAALTEMFAARFTVLNGRAGTGKTTLVKALISRPDVTARRVLLLAPTGKARVQLEAKVGHPASTVAQFLARSKRFDGDDGSYFSTGDAASRDRFGTVVVDEASMLTESMLDALLDALHPPDRLVLVGDPRQLPPIGPGRPFVDLEGDVRRAHDGRWPHTAPGWCELTVLRRQRGGGRARDDLQLAQWFGGDELPEGADDVWDRLRTGATMPTLRAVPWAGRSAGEVLDAVLAEELDVTEDGGRSFAASYGATIDKYVDYGSAAQQCERWQVLSPTRGRAHGTVGLNRHLKAAHRRDELEKALRRRYRTVPRPLGWEQIVLGDKVVNLENRTFPAWSRDQGKQRVLVANGEIGVVTGQVSKKAPWATQVEFLQRAGLRVTVNGAVSESDASLELAWALTVHKSQGSEFGLVILMLPEHLGALSRELIYTALTRQTSRIVLCHEGPLDHLLDLTRATGSETARRYTDLVRPADPVTVTSADGQHAYVVDRGLSHITTGGVLVRSKNEVIIADILDDLVPGQWSYEAPFTGDDGRTVRPDFTAVLPDGQIVLWEHLGMLDSPTYKEAWHRKQQWYTEQGVHTPDGPAEGRRATLITTSSTAGVDVPAWRAIAESALTGAAPRMQRRARVRRGR
ncbi:AAA family ATPase [Actinomycetospora atypica]|uniref:AAA family ATPase n=1 Tax=Actinomycetospora atypica TaxID=1290095 RepID=A0ABV9YPJ3_9PSEU